MRALRPGAKRSISAAQLASSEAGATSRQGGSLRSPACRRCTSSSASTWSVLPSPMSSARQAPSPSPVSRCSHCHAGALIGPQDAVQRRAGIHPGAVRRAQRLQHVRQPGTGADLGPSGCGGIGGVGGDRGAGQQAHRLGEGQAVFRRQLLGFAEPAERALQPGPVHLHPLPAQQHQALGAGEQGADLLLGQGLAAERHCHVEVEQPVEAKLRGRAAADLRRHQRPGGAPGRPRRRHAHHHAGGFQVGHAFQQARRLRRRPAQRMEDLAGVDHRRAASRSARRRAAPAAAATAAGCGWPRRRIRAGPRRAGGGGRGPASESWRRVGRHEGERRLRIATVLGQVEVHAADQVPGPVQPLEDGLQRGAGLRHGGGHGEGEFRPQGAQHVRRQVLGARHHRRRQHQRGEFALGRRRDLRHLRLAAGGGAVLAQRRHVAAGKAAPPDEGRRQGLPHLAGAEPHQPGAAALGERSAEPPGRGGVHGGRVGGRFAEEMAVGGEAKPQARGGRPGRRCSGERIRSRDTLVRRRPRCHITPHCESETRQFRLLVAPAGDTRHDHPGRMRSPAARRKGGSRSSVVTRCQ